MSVACRFVEARGDLMCGEDDLVRRPVVSCLAMPQVQCRLTCVSSANSNAERAG